jgi:hypothetical protein
MATNHGMRALFAAAVVASWAAAQAPARPTLAQLERRAAGLLPTQDQLRYQEIPWIHDLAEAQATAVAERRPLFLWGYGGRARPDNGLEGC